MNEENGELQPKSEEKLKPWGHVKRVIKYTMRALLAAAVLWVIYQGLFLLGYIDNTRQELDNAVAAIEADGVPQGELEMEVVKAVGDKNCFRVEFNVILPDSVPLDRTGYAFRYMTIDSHFSEGGGSYGVSAPEPGENIMRGYVEYSSYSNPFDKFKNKKVDIWLGDLICDRQDGEAPYDFTYLPEKQAVEDADSYLLDDYMYTEWHTEEFETESKLLQKGLWHLNVPLRFKSSAEVYKIDQSIPDKQGTMSVKRVEISDYSVVVSVEGKNYSEIGADELKIFMKDGTVKDGEGNSGSQNSDTKEYKNAIRATYEEPITPEDIVRIELRGEVLEYR